MNRLLNRSALSDALIKAGMNQSTLAEKLNVSREAVSKWVRGDSFPQPDKLIRIGLLVGLSFDEMVTSPPPVAVPVVTYRKKANRTTKDIHLDNARENGELLKRLVPYLPDKQLTQPPTLKDPTLEYDYTQAVASELREEMNLSNKAVIDFTDLIDKFNRLHAVIIPVLWGAKEHHGNALNIHLPDSKTTWVFLNLDSNTIDFKFWMAHELGHCLIPSSDGQFGEDFADSFAQALLFPEAKAKQLYATLNNIQGIPQIISRIKDEAKTYLISPYTIRKAVEEYARARQLPEIQLGQLPSFMGGVRNFCKGYKTISQAIYKNSPPEPSEYITSGVSQFGSPFFTAIAEFCKKEKGSEHFIHSVLGVSLADAKALSAELQK